MMTFGSFALVFCFGLWAIESLIDVASVMSLVIIDNNAIDYVKTIIMTVLRV